MVRFLLLIVVFASLATPVQARWFEASSEHFVIYADDDADDIREFAENLERYHSAMRYVTGRQVPVPSASNRVTIFVVGGERELQKLYGGDDKSVAGFYVPRAGSSRAFVQEIRSKRGYPSFSTVILLHEYAHHFLVSTSRYAMPRWMSEGAAEFFSAATSTRMAACRSGAPLSTVLPNWPMPTTSPCRNCWIESFTKHAAPRVVIRFTPAAGCSTIT